MSEAPSTSGAAQKEAAASEWRGIGTSMLPFVPPGSRLFLRRGVDGRREARIGDIVCFLGADGRFIAHRVVGVKRADDRRLLLVAGDSSGFAEEVEATAVVAVVERVEHRLIAYDTGGPLGRALARMAVRRTRVMRGALSFSRAAIALYLALPNGAVREIARRWLRGEKG